VNSTIQSAASESSQQPQVQPKKKSTTLGTEIKAERIRAELNIEKWPAIWNPTHSKSHTKLNVQSRTLERESTAPDGTKTVSKVAINPIAQLGDLTTEDQRTLYALIKHWEDRGKSPQETPFSIRHMAKLLHKKGWGTNVIDAVTGSLERLRGTLLVWTRSYRSKDQRVEDLETVYVNILSKLKIVRRKIDGHVTIEAGYFQFDDHILKNLLSNYTKPFLFDVFIDIQGEIALKLYSYLDLIMADKNHFERRTKELFEDLGLNGASYRHPSKRKQNLEKAFAELTGLMLTTGVLKSATIERTKDEKDFKAVFQKVPRSQMSAEELEPPIKFVTEESVVINDYSRRKDPLTEQAETAVRFFHRKIHGVENHVPQSKEVSQALTLIGQHGVDKTHSIIEYAAEQAAETNFKIQHFGAILSYTSRALAAHDRQQSTAEPAVPSRPLPQGRQTWERGEARLAVLTQGQYQLRFEQAKARLFREYPSMAGRLKTGSKILQSTIRARVVRDLDGEPMDLILLPPALSATCRWHRPAQNLPI
jgi:hypothetical protein